MPVLAVGAAPIGDATARQLRPICVSLPERALPRSGHIVAVDEPDALAAHVMTHARRP